MLKLDTANSTNRGAKKCKYALVLDADEQQQLEQFKRDHGASYKRLETVLKGNGIDLSASAVRNHFAGECACITAEVSA